MTRPLLFERKAAAWLGEKVFSRLHQAFLQTWERSL